MTPADIERATREAFDAGDLDRAVTVAIREYGPELYGFLVVASGDDDLAAEAFSETCHHLWRDLGKFRWESSLRTWAYTIARRRLYAAREARNHRRVVPLSRASELEAMVRTATASYLRSEVKAHVAKLRAELDEDERMLLVLRVDRDLSWKEIAAVIGESEATLRKRFERIKDRLRELVKTTRPS